MTSVSQTFGIYDIREKILSHRRELMIPELTKKIYPKWKYNKKTKEYYVKVLPGPNSEPNTKVVIWSLLSSPEEKIDTHPLLITDIIHNNDKQEKMDGLINTAHIDLRKQDWYIREEDIRTFVLNSTDEEVGFYYYCIDFYYDQEYEKRMKLMDKEMMRRNAIAECLVYKLPKESTEFTY